MMAHFSPAGSLSRTSRRYKWRGLRRGAYDVNVRLLSRGRSGIGRRRGAPAGLAGLAPLFAFFGGHTFPAVAHFAAEAGAIAAAMAHATEKVSAKRQQADRLPEGDCFPAEQRRKQPIPEMHYDFAADPDKSWDCHNCEGGDPEQLLFVFHVVHGVLLTSPKNLHRCSASVRANAARRNVCARAAC